MAIDRSYLERNDTERARLRRLVEHASDAELARPLDDGWSLEPGAGARASMGFSIPADFVPTKLLLRQAAAPKDRAFRITIRPTDLGPAPAATP